MRVAVTDCTVPESRYAPKFLAQLTSNKTIRHSRGGSEVSVSPRCETYKDTLQMTCSPRGHDTLRHSSWKCDKCVDYKEMLMFLQDRSTIVFQTYFEVC